MTDHTRLESATSVDAHSDRPLVYTINLLEPATQHIDITLELPCAGGTVLDLMMPIWSPGFYCLEPYAEQVQNVAAHTREGSGLVVERPAPHRWRIHVPDHTSMIRVTYRLVCNRTTVTTNWVNAEYAVLNGPATFITIADTHQRRHELVLHFPEYWTQVCTGLPVVSESVPHHYYADDFDRLVDAPIVIGTPISSSFTVDGRRHDLIAVGDLADWDNQRMAHDLAQVVHEHWRFWKTLPYQYYVFLLVFREGGGGLEHSNSTLVTARPSRVGTPEGYQALLSLISHEFFHAVNVKRLRPRELGPFNYEEPPRTLSLWVAEGLTCYYTDLLLCRAGLRTPEWLIAMLADKIAQLQAAPGRLVQTLEQSSYGVWDNSFSGLNPTDSTVSYYIKGHVVGWLLDAHLRQATEGHASLDDLMRLAYARYSGEHGFTPAAFRAIVAEIGGEGVANWLETAVASVAELDYTIALAWFGLRFAQTDGQQPNWQLEIDPAARQEQIDRLQTWVIGRSAE